MAAGPLARLISQLVVPFVAVIARALPAAYAQALHNAKKAGMDANNPSVKNMLRKTIDKSEALNILNLTETEATVEAVQKVRDCGRIVNQVIETIVIAFFGMSYTSYHRNDFLLFSNTKSTWLPMTCRKVAAFTYNQKYIAQRSC